MKALVVGGGSIGKRHLGNLQSLGVADVALVEPDDARRQGVCQEKSATGFPTLATGLEWNPDFVVIATPSHLHVPQAREVAAAGLPLFVEKPLSHDGDGLRELAEAVAARGLVSLVGCNMRFHFGPRTVKQVLDEGRIGRVLFARVHTGSYLPGWRPWMDYRDSYSAHAAQGGGCILDCIHEIDLARWYLGDVASVYCLADHLSSQETDVEDVALLTCRHANGTVSHVHLDYVQRTYERGCQIVGEDGSIFWDFRGRTVRVYEADGERWTEIAEPADWEINQMYVDEMRHFLDCVRTGAPTTLSVPDAVEVMRVALAAKESSRTGRAVATKEVLP